MQLWSSCSLAYIGVDKNGQNLLHLAALQSIKQMIQSILIYCPEKHKNDLVNKQDNNGNTPLHLLIKGGCLVPELLKYEGLDTSVKNNEDRIPSDMLYVDEEMINDQVKIKVALDHIQIDQKRDIFSSLELSNSKREKKDENFKKQAENMIDEKLTRMKEDTRAVAKCFADAISGDPISRAALEMEADTLNPEGKTILHVESTRGDTERVRYIVREFANKNLLVKLDRLNQTALHLAAHHGHTQVVEVLIDAALHLPSYSANSVSSFQDFIRQVTGPMRNTALHFAVLNCNATTVKLLVQADPNDNHVQNNEGKTPIYIAAEKGYKEILNQICTTCTALSLDGPGGRTTALHALIHNIGQGMYYLCVNRYLNTCPAPYLDSPDGSSALHAAIRNDNGKEEDNDLIMMTINAAKRWSFEALFHRTDESGRTPLELAMYHNHVNTVELILCEDPAYQDGRGSKNHGILRLINQAMDNKYSKHIVQLLSQTFEAGMEPDLKGVLALIIAIQRRDTDPILKLLEEANKRFLSFVDSKGWTLLHHAAYHEFDSILGIMIEAQEKVGHQFVYEYRVATPFHVAAKCGYTSTVIRLMQVLRASPSWYTTVDENDQNILHLAAVQNKKEMANGILRYCPTTHKDLLLSQKDIKGNTPLHLLVSQGCFIEDLVDYIAGDKTQNKEYWTPRDMLYFQHDIVREQVQIKMALDDIDTDQSGTFWSTSRKKNTFSSLVLPSRKEQKDIIFYEAENFLRDAKNAKMKEDLQRYREGTNSQIVVSALITTITFTVGFTIPGGLHQSGESNEGLAVLSKKAAFKVFMISDALALLLSICSLFIYFLENMSQDLDQVTRLHATTVGLNIASVMLTMFIFMTGTYVVLSQSLALTITICVIGSLFFVFVIVQLLRVLYDRRVRKNEDYKKEA